MIKKQQDSKKQAEQCHPTNAENTPPFHASEFHGDKHLLYFLLAPVEEGLELTSPLPPPAQHGVGCQIAHGDDTQLENEVEAKGSDDEAHVAFVHLVPSRVGVRPWRRRRQQRGRP